MLTKHFGGIRAVDSVSFTVSRGEVTGIIGPNGAGKTTLFNVVTGFIRPDGGKVIFKGVDITRKSTAEVVRLGVARTFQLVRPFLRLSVKENVMIPALISTKKNPEQKVREVLEATGLDKKETWKASMLTHAELKILEIARAVATSPELMLLDEPYGGLGKDEISKISNLIAELARKGITLLIIEHRLSELMKNVSRVVVMDQGKIIADGPPEEVVLSEKVIQAYLGSKKMGVT